MANKKVTDLVALTSVATDDICYIVETSSGASKKITVANLTALSAGTVVTTKVSINNASVLDLKYDDTPITLKAAEASKIIVPVSCVVVATHAGSNETSTTDLRIGYSASDSTTAQYWAGFRNFMDSVTSGTITFLSGGPTNGGSTNSMTFSITNKPIQIWSTDVYNGGWRMDVYFSYYMVDA